MSLIRDEGNLLLENILFKNVELNKVHTKEFKILNACNLPLKIKWDKYYKENVFKQCNNLQI